MGSKIKGIGVLGIFLLSLTPGIFAFDFSTVESKIVEHKLTNGLTLIIYPKHDAPVISCYTHVNYGGAEDPLGSMGISHMFEHMAFKGNTEIGTTDYRKEKKWMDEEDRIFELILDERAKGALADSDRLAALDAQMKAATDSAARYIVNNEYSQLLEMEGVVGKNAGTSRDATVYYMSLPSNKLELWMYLESTRFLEPVLREFFQEKQVVAEERRYRVESSPTGRLFQSEYVGLAFNAHPYGKCLTGEMTEIQNYSRAAMRRQIENEYVPGNMVVSIVGDVDPKNAIKLAEKYFGRLIDRKRSRPLMIDEAEPYGVRTTTLYENAQPLFVMGYRIPANTHPDWHALDALSSYLGSGRTSVLYKKLVKEDKTAVEVGAFTGYPASKYASLFSVLCIPSNESSNSANMETILAEIEKVRNELIPESELEKIKAQSKSDFINLLGSNNGMAGQLAAFQARTGNWRDLFKELDKINSLTTEDIRRVAQLYLDPSRRVVGSIEKPEESL
jgi:predicted Zn-dependent peptidase